MVRGGPQARSLKTSSATSAMSDTYETHRGRLDEFRAKLGYVDGAAGLAVAVGPAVVALDLFDKPSTCRKVWDRLLSGFVMDALEETQSGSPADPAQVDALVKRLRAAPWQKSPPSARAKTSAPRPGPRPTPPR